MLIAALCHDLGHDGLSNSYHGVCVVCVSCVCIVWCVCCVCMCVYVHVCLVCCRVASRHRKALTAASIGTPSARIT
jgi:hypothetical protein